eukprot:9485614-Pyramimonas_sp.AAC.1
MHVLPEPPSHIPWCASSSASRSWRGPLPPERRPCGGREAGAARGFKTPDHRELRRSAHYQGSDPSGELQHRSRTQSRRMGHQEGSQVRLNRVAKIQEELHCQEGSHPKGCSPRRN